jgi:polysaccharide export outer membrane protein
MIRWTSLFALLATVFTSGDALAEEAYRIQPGDVLNVTVSPQTAYGRVVTVQPDGKVSYPVAGELQAAGQTIKEFSRELAKGLEQELNAPQVTVSLQSSAPKQAPQITVLGAVRAPGLFDLRAGWRLTEALAAAGGPAPNADLRRITVTRADRTVRSADLTLTAEGAQRENVALEEGDLIIVLEGKQERATITVLGAVVRPGAYELATDMTLLEALTLAGGPTPKAELRRAALARVGAPGLQAIDLERLLKGDANELNVKLKPGDALVLHENLQLAVVIGEVARQGEIALAGGETVLDLLIRAGGPTGSAHLSKANILRRGHDGKPQTIEVNIDKLRKGKSDPPLVKSGDLLFIPPRDGRRRNWTEYVNPLSLVFGLFGGF